MECTGHLVWCWTLCLLMTVPWLYGQDTSVCSVTNGYKLKSFLRAGARIQLPCRYVLGEFFCNKKILITVQSSLASDGYTYISSVTVRKSRGMQDGKGGVVEDYDQAFISMEDFRQFLEDGKLQKDHWQSSGEALYWSGSKKRRLQGTYDPTTGQTVLTDGSNTLHVYFSHVDPDSDGSRGGNLTVICSDPGMTSVLGSPGYFCGNVGSAVMPTDNRKHLKDAAKELKMDLDDYVTYNILVEQDVEQTDPTCQTASQLTKDCSFPKEVVSKCGSLLNRKTYDNKCVKDDKVKPLEAYIRCVRWQCKNEWDACVALGNTLKECEKGKKIQKNLPCLSGGYGY